ncbi:hypothetical protein BZA77DRAFT_360159 [Pyronema omphalodes]|nr:hypothetical protein BZA77DRAFT_360159 [Pyronema omphalodes]
MLQMKKSEVREGWIPYTYRDCHKTHPQSPLPFFPTFGTVLRSSIHNVLAMKQQKIVTLIAAVIAATAVASPRRGGVDELGGIDMGSIQNKVRSGAIAIANSDRPRDERKNQSHYRNGDKVDTTITDVPEREEQPCEHQCEHKCDHHKHERRAKMRGDCQAEFPRLATLADSSEVEDTYQCCAVLPEKDITNFDGTAVARVLGYYEINPLKSYINNVPNTNGTCIDSCVEAGYDALTSAGPDGCQCMNTFNIPVQLPEFQSVDEYDMDNCLAVYRVDFVAPKKAAPTSVIEEAEFVEPVEMVNAAIEEARFVEEAGLVDAAIEEAEFVEPVGVDAAIDNSEFAEVVRGPKPDELASPEELSAVTEPTEVIDTVETPKTTKAAHSNPLGVLSVIGDFFSGPPKSTIVKDVFVTKIATHTIPTTAEVTSTKVKQVVVTEVQTAFMTKTKVKQTTATLTSTATKTAYTTATESRIFY